MGESEALGESLGLFILMPTSHILSNGSQFFVLIGGVKGLPPANQHASPYLLFTRTT